MSSGDIDDSQIITSSESASAFLSRLSDGTGWSPSAGDEVPWIKIKLLALTEITGVITKGGSVSNGWVTEYKLSYEDVTDSYKDVPYTHSFGDKKVNISKVTFS